MGEPHTNPEGPPTEGESSASTARARSERALPKDGGTMLSAAAVFGSLSLFSRFDNIHLGPGPIPLWVPLAVDTAIAGVCGAVLVLAGHWFTEDPVAPSADFVVVARPVWDRVQREIVAHRPAAPPIPEASIPPVPTEPPAIPEAAPLNPWDEGPPTPLVAQSDPGAPEVPAPVSVPVPTPTAMAASPPGPPALAPEELEEIARMGGILGVVPRPGETGSEYSVRLAKAREEMAEAAPGTPVTKSPAPRGPATPEPAASLTTDIDELMGWLDKLVAEPPGSSFPAEAKPVDGKRKPASDDEKSAGTGGP